MTGLSSIGRTCWTGLAIGISERSIGRVARRVTDRGGTELDAGVALGNERQLGVATRGSGLGGRNLEHTIAIYLDGGDREWRSGQVGL